MKIHEKEKHICAPSSLVVEKKYKYESICKTHKEGHAHKRGRFLQLGRSHKWA